MTDQRTPPFVVKPYMFGEDCIGNDPAPTDEDAPDYNRRIQEWFRRQEEYFAAAEEAAG